MIKVNLLKNKQKKSSSGEDTQFGNFQFGAGDTSKNELIKRAAMLLIPIVLAYGYNWYSTNSLQTQIKAINSKIATVKSQSDGLKPQLQEIEKLNVEKNKITTQIDVFKGLSKSRYSTVKILDSIQTLIPEKAWIVKMSIRDNSINLEGRAIDDLVISTFMQNVEESAYFSNVTWIDSKEVNEPQGLVKQFSIRFQVEKI